ncbi:hypothetical protein ACFXJ8_14160 [Nonomuraea sp. NPDC059194]|uniref:hypothetical protein n=1 Tax=Nonomuraea sp. NPDC059194 TaxID=3346764 RepID=UPI0036C8039F
MNPSRKMWVSAAAVGVIVVGGVSVAAAASAGRLEKVSQETRAVVNTPPASSDQPAVTNTTNPANPEIPAGTGGGNDDPVVSHEVNQDPQEVVDYWTDTRMEGAEPMPMPEAPGKLNDVDD